jgi:predicted nucleic-acid-binding Zn-ribbon protein
MKRSHACPKCAGRKIWVIEPFRLPIEERDGAMLPSRMGEVLPLVAHQNPGGVMTRPIGHLAAYICAGCGYSELYADDFETLAPDPAKGVRLLDAPAGGPFR